MSSLKPPAEYHPTLTVISETVSPLTETEVGERRRLKTAGLCRLLYSVTTPQGTIWT